MLEQWLAEVNKTWVSELCQFLNQVAIFEAIDNNWMYTPYVEGK